MEINLQTKKLGEVCDFSRGLTYSKKDEVDFSDNIVLRSNNIDLNSGLLDLSDLRYISNTIMIPDNKMVRRGSIIVCTANGSKSHLGKIALIDGDYKYAFGGFMGQLTPKECIDSKYFFYILSSSFYKDHLEKISSGANINNLKFTDLKDFEIPILPLPEQQRIVKILDEVFEGIVKVKKNTEKNLQNAKELFESYLQSIFSNPGEGWEEKRLGDISEKITDGTHQTPTYYDSGIIFLSSEMLRAEKLIGKRLNILTKNNISKMHKRVSPRLGDILLAKNGTTGVAAMVDRNLVFDIYVSLALIRAKDAILPNFLLYFINSPMAKKQFNKRLKGVGVPNLHLEEIREVFIQFPRSLHQQKKIVAKLDALSEQTKKLEGLYKQKLLDLEELKKSVLKKAFSGEL